ncbi:MAG TPA: efflux RND transporter periplasmic adaptor subunit [Actinobacteria bacterium]|nr:efflux RND transporter periplasmic adaptor subunit [Actinomycetota bacterium]
MVLILIAVGGFLFFFRRGMPEVETAKAMSGTISVTISAAGELEARNQEEVAADVSGIIKALPLKDGSQVKKGDVILELDEEQLSFAEKQAYAAYLSAEANLEKLDSLPTASDEELDAAEAQVEQAEMAYEIAKKNLANVKLIAPINGVLIYCASTLGVAGQGGALTVGAAIQQGQILFAIADLSKMNFVANVDETDVGRVKVGQEVEVTIDAYSGEIIKGKVVKIGSVSSVTTTGATIFPIEIELEPSSLDLKLGMNGSVEIIEIAKDNVVKVPIEAVVERENKDVVFVLKDNIVEEREVEGGLSDEMYIEIKSGIKIGDEVIISGTDKLKDGDKVKVVD